MERNVDTPQKDSHAEAVASDGSSLAALVSQQGVSGDPVIEQVLDPLIMNWSKYLSARL